MASDPLLIADVERGLRHDGSVRLAAVTRGAEVRDRCAEAQSLGLVLEDGAPELDLDDLTTVRPERVLALDRERGLAVTTIVSKGGDKLLGRKSEHRARVVAIATGKRRSLAFGRQFVAAGISPNGEGVIVLDEEGAVLCYDLTTQAYPGGARAREPEDGKYACIALANGGRLWLASTGGALEVRVMGDRASATLDLSELGDEIRRAHFLPDGSGFVVATEHGLAMRFELLLDHVGPSHEARIATIADAVDAWIAGTRWIRYAPRVEVYDERTENERSTLFFVASHYEYHHAQSGSDWAEHYLCAGHAIFEGARRIDVQLTSKEPRRLTERADETYDASAEVAAFRAAAARATAR